MFHSTVRVLPLLVVVACAPRLYSPNATDSTDPPTPLEWEPPENRWPSDAPPSNSVGQGFALGQHVPDVRVADQFGEVVSLWQFSGRVILLDVSTMWCAPCQELAEGTEETIELFEARPFTYVTVLQEDVESNPPDGVDLNLWADNFGISGPVLADGDKITAGAVVQGQYPAVLVIGPDLRVRERVNPPNDAEVHLALERAFDAL